MPSVQKAHDQFRGQGVAVLTISIDASLRKERRDGSRLQLQEG